MTRIKLKLFLLIAAAIINANAKYCSSDDYIEIGKTSGYSIHHAFGDAADTGTFDMLSSFRLDTSSAYHNGVRVVAGSTQYQTAYHLEEHSNMTRSIWSVFPRGVPYEFSFECTFRLSRSEQQRSEWYLFELTNQRYESLMSITMDPIYNSIDFSLPKYGGVQTVSFENIQIFDFEWHKLMLSVTRGSLRLWIDCVAVPDLSGNLESPLDVRAPFSVTDGSFSIAKDCRSRATVPIDLQWMIFSQDVDKPLRTSCNDLLVRSMESHTWHDGYELQFASTTPAPLEPKKPNLSIEPRKPSIVWFENNTPASPALTGTERKGIETTPSTPRVFWEESTTEPTAFAEREETRCPDACLRGLPGPPGPPGPAGHIGLPGMPGPIGPPGNSIDINMAKLELKGEKGEAGLPGADGMPGRDGQTIVRQEVQKETATAEPAGGLSEQDVRNICMAVVRDYVADYGSRLNGPPGPAGQAGRPGRPGAQGIQGEQGLRGLTGERGYPGMPGAQGPPGGLGAQGPPGLKGERGVDAVGHDGPPGVEGPTGLPGPSGRDGVPGRTGDRGDTGYPGMPGARGPPGEPGVCPLCAAYSPQDMYPYLLAQQQQYNNKGPQAYYNNKGPQDYNIKG